MAKIRVYELAKKLGYQNKVFVEELRQEGIEIKSHMSTVDEETAEFISTIFAPRKAPSGKAPEKTPAIIRAVPSKAPRKAEAAPARMESKEEGAQKKAQEKVTSSIKGKKVSAPPSAVAAEAEAGKPVQPQDVQDAEVEEEKEAPPGPSKTAAPPEIVPAEQPHRPRKIRLGESITVKELSEKLSLKVAEVIKDLMKMGHFTTINQTIGYQTASDICDLHQCEAEVTQDRLEKILVQKDDAPEDLKPRAPVVTIMGHVDHGKTRLLDAIRKENVMEKEAGGITQHIGAYSASTEKGACIFLDTPGHEAFTAMRARGAEVTDIVVLVVAADDGVMPQTREAISHARAADVPIMVAVNKMDLPNANPDRVKQQLSEHDLISEEWGGDTVFCGVSAKQGEGIGDLLELIILQADLMELKANPDRDAVGVIIEAKLEKGRGPVATVLIQRGTLHVGNNFLAGSWNGKVRALLDDKGQKLKSAGPSTPVEILGFTGVPKAGDEFIVVSDDRVGREISARRQRRDRLASLLTTSRISLDNFLANVKEGKAKELNLILRTDVQGSIEALRESLLKLGNEEVGVRILHGSTGGITESDIMLAAASSAVIVGFNVRPTRGANETAKREKVDIRLYSVIYDAIAEVKSALEGILEPITKETVIGHAEVRQTFHIPGVGTICGSYITDGNVARGSPVRLIRDNVIIYTARISSLRRFKDDVREVQQGYECGIGIENFNDVKEGDIIEPFVTEEVARTL